MALTGIIFDLKKYAIHDGPGIRTTVFLKGCPLDCWWCHNPEGRKTEAEVISVKARRNDAGEDGRTKNELIGREISVNDLLIEIRKDIIFYDQSGGGVTFSGGEPMMQIDFLEGILAECKNAGISTAVDTCGYAPFIDLERIYGLVDIFLFDLKIIDDNLHIKYTGVSNKQILENLSLLSQMGGKVKIRIPIIPSIIDTDGNLNAISDFLRQLKNINHVSLLPYNKLGEDKRDKFNMENKLGRLQSPSNQDMQRLAENFKADGFRVKIGG